MLLRAFICFFTGLGLLQAQSEAPPGAIEFDRTIKPLLENYCYDCHGDGERKGNIALDAFESSRDLLSNIPLWSQVLQNLEAGLMPPARKLQPSPEERARILAWIKQAVFQIDPARPDPGRVTLRRLNRVEYRNTIRDLTGVNYNTDAQFPADDTGHGFDNIGDVLTLSPMLLEKYVSAANAIVAEALAPGKNPKRFFPKPPPENPAEHRAYAREILRDFARRAFRRPADDATLHRLVELAETTWQQPGKTVQQGVAQAFVAVLASPQFLFRVEGTEAGAPGDPHLWIDQYALASRLSYFLWSSMPDQELFQLAARGELRKNLNQQVRRMLADRRSEAFIRNFTGQWLHARDIDSVPIDARAVLDRDGRRDPEEERLRKRVREIESIAEPEFTEELRRERNDLRRRLAALRDRPPGHLSGELRRAMRQETERYFEYVLREDRSLLEMIDSDYTFLNEVLAKHYGVPEVTGSALQRVTLPPGSPRGGVLTHGTVLAVTSNPTRTSPVKRGVFVLDNILGTPPPPPPPGIPPLEAAVTGISNRPPTLRESLAAHREDALCRSCHNRMDPIGLAFENFNALGMWRETDRNQPIDAGGTLITGESFTNIVELKRVLARNHSRQFYRTLTGKLLTYALGRGMEYYEVATLDPIVDRIEQAGGRPSALLAGIVESAPFQKTRRPGPPQGNRADAAAPESMRLASAPEQGATGQQVQGIVSSLERQ